MSVAVRTEALTKRYGPLAAVDDLTIEVPTGSVYGLIGPNGAGKSTAFAVLATLLRPTAGRAEVVGHDPITEPLEVRRRVGYMPDVMGVYGDLHVDEYLDFFAAAYDIPSDERAALIDGLLELVDLAGKREAMVDSLSRGMKQRLNLARALVHDPDLLILDEPASGLDAKARVELRQLIGELRSLGKTVVISSHILAELEDICTEVGILEAGKLLVQGTPGDIRRTLEPARIVRVRFADGAEETHEVADDHAQASLLHRLVAEEGRAVVEFTEEGRRLEDIYMRITKGTVQ